MFEQPDPNAAKKEEAVEYIDKKKVEDKTPKNVQFGMAAYSVEAMGAIQYGNVGQWLQQVVGQVRPEGLPVEEGDTSGYGSSSSSSSSRKEVEDVGPLEEMTALNFDALCPIKNKLCSILLVDGSNKESTKLALEGVEIAKNKERG